MGLTRPFQNDRLHRRFIVLGASNVTRSFRTLIDAARDRWDEPLEVVAAHGHGRSFGGAWSTVFVRKLPGILHSELWNSVGLLPAKPAVALVTDIGNDILYGYPVATIAHWVEECLDRLAVLRAETTVSSLPLENFSGLSEARYKFFRNLFMPGCPLSRSQVLDLAFALDERVSTLVKDRGMRLVTQRREWYGLDPLHVRYRNYPRVWREVLGAEPNIANRAFSPQKLAETWYLRTRVPARVRWFGRELKAAQPSAHLRDGTTIALY